MYHDTTVNASGTKGLFPALSGFLGLMILRNGLRKEELSAGTPVAGVE
jgi:hypothetical protein